LVDSCLSICCSKPKLIAIFFASSASKQIRQGSYFKITDQLAHSHVDHSCHTQINLTHQQRSQIGTQFLADMSTLSTLVSCFLFKRYSADVQCAMVQGLRIICSRVSNTAPFLAPMVSGTGIINLSSPPFSMTACCCPK